MKPVKQYVQGKTHEDVARVAQTSDIIKVGSNENILGPSPKAVAAAAEAFKNAHLYPSNQEVILTDKLAAHVGGELTRDNFTTGNGSSDVLRQIVNAFIGSGDKALICKPTFAMYEILVAMRGGETVNVPHKNFAIDLEAMGRAVDEKTKLVFVCNPNNPTGLTVTHEAFKAFLEGLPEHVVVILDGAYREFADDPAMPRELELIDAGYTIIATRTFSKLYGLAGLRVGYGFGPTNLMAKVRAEKIHFNSSHIAFVAATAALEDKVHGEASLAMTRTAREQYYQAFTDMDIPYFPTQANFILFWDVPVDAGHLCDEAMKRGLILRQADVWDLPEMVRITFAREHENERIIEALRDIIAS